MKTLFFYFFSFLASISVLHATATPRNLLQNEATVQQVKERLLSKDKWIAYPSYTDRNGWNRITTGVSSNLIKQGESFLNYQWQVVKATDYLAYERTGSRTTMEQPYNQNVTAVAQLMIAELSEGKGRFMDQIINGVWTLCDMQSWALSAHLPAQKMKRSLPDPDEELIDLVSGDVGSLLSWATYFFKDNWDKVNPVIAKRVEQNIKKRILEPYMQRSDYWWQALQNTPNQMVNNWNPWCNANVLACFLLMEKNTNTLAAAVYKTMRSVDQFINYVKEDGACEEGPSYWGHAAGKLYDYLQLLSDATSGKISIFNRPMVKNMGEYIVRSYVGNGWVVNFADASAKENTNPGLVYRYGKAVNSNEMQAFATSILSEQKNKNTLSGGRDMYRTLESIKGYQELNNAPATTFQTPNYTWYPQTEFCYMKNQQGWFFAAKGGFNDESHNHNDIGSFNLYLDKTPFIIDVGVGTYTRQTFSSERYSIWTMQSNFHNLPLINGQPQLYGRKYKASETSFDKNKMQFQLNIAGAYGPKADVKKWMRTYTLTSKGLQIDDHYELLAIKDTTALNFMTWVQPNINNKGKVLLSKDGKSIALEYSAALLQPLVEKVPVTDQRLSKVWGDQVYRLTFISKNKSLKGAHKIFITQ